MSNLNHEGNKKGIRIALLITAGVMILEFFGGMASNSLALLSDSGHMLGDVFSLGLTLLAMGFASKPPSNKNTFGYYRLEILVALFNSFVLLFSSGVILYHAVDRILHPQSVGNGYMIVIGFIGLLSNLSSAYFLMNKGDVKNNLNLRSAYLHVLGDAFTSIGVVLSGALIFFFSFKFADSLMSMVTAFVFAKGAWEVAKNSLHILMQGTPDEINQEEVVEVLAKIEGVRNVHDLHIWTVASGFDTLSCHLLVDKEKDNEKILAQAIDKIKNHFSIHHVTIQIEKTNYR